MVRRHCEMLASISGVVLLKKEGKRRRMRSSTGCSGVATLATKRLLPKRHSQASGPRSQVYRKPGRVCWKVTTSVLQNKSMFLFCSQVIIHICPTYVFYPDVWGTAWHPSAFWWECVAVINTKFLITLSIEWKQFLYTCEVLFVKANLVKNTLPQ
jgi:hypothetical protein